MLTDLHRLITYHLRLNRARAALPQSITKVAYGPHRRQYYLLMQPEDSRDTDDRPWALYFHGGAWTLGRPEWFVPSARVYLELGFRVVLASHRRPPRYRMPDIVEDLGALAGAVVDHARAGGKPLFKGLHLAGMSAGGHLAAWLSLQPGLLAHFGWPGPVRSLLLCAAPTDLRLLRPRPLFKNYAAYNPALFLENYRAALPPTLLIHAEDDQTVALQHSQNYLALVRAAGGSANLITLPGGGHTAAAAWSYDWSGEVYRTVYDFVASRL